MVINETAEAKQEQFKPYRSPHGLRWGTKQAVKGPV